MGNSRFRMINKISSLKPCSLNEHKNEKFETQSIWDFPPSMYDFIYFYVVHIYIIVWYLI